MERKFVPTMALIAVLLVTGGTSLAAEKSLPGDSLYSLKININEQIKALSAVTPEAKAKFASDSTNERLKEAAVLSSRGQLTGDNKQLIQKQISKNAGEIKNQVASLVSTNNLKSAQSVTVNFESTLKAHALILEKLSSSEATTTTDGVGSLLVVVKDELATTTASRINFNVAEFKADSNNREKVQASLQAVITSFLDAEKILRASSVSTSTEATALASFIDIAKAISEATLHINQAVYPEALIALQRAEQAISDTVALINAGGDVVDTNQPKDESTNIVGTSTTATSTVLGTSTVATSTDTTATTPPATTTPAV